MKNLKDLNYPFIIIIFCEFLMYLFVDSFSLFNNFDFMTLFVTLLIFFFFNAMASFAYYDKKAENKVMTYEEADKKMSRNYILSLISIFVIYIIYLIFVTIKNLINKTIILNIYPKFGADIIREIVYSERPILFFLFILNNLIMILMGFYLLYKFYRFYKFDLFNIDKQVINMPSLKKESFWDKYNVLFIKILAVSFIIYNFVLINLLV